MLAARTKDARMVAPWIADSDYGPLESESQSIIRGMAFLGHAEFARRSLDYFIARYNKEGFVTPTYTIMGTGWHLWMLGEFASLTQDHEWMRRNADEVARVCRWIVAQRKKNMKPGSVEYGFMPPGPCADWETFAYYFGMNGYFKAGLDTAGKALASVGHPDAQEIIAAGVDMGREIERGFRHIQSLAPVVPLQDGSWTPYYPVHLECPLPIEELYRGEDGGRSWCYDIELGAHHLIAQGVMPPRSREARWMLNHMEDVMFLRSGWGEYIESECKESWYNLGGFSKVQPYYTRNVEVYALQDEVKPFIRGYFNTLPSLLDRENLSIWEHFFPGAYNKTHETGYFLYQTRLMLAMERGDDLWLAPFVTSNWLKNGMSIAVRNLPTCFGPVTYKIDSHAEKGFIDAVIEPPSRPPPKHLVIRIRHPDNRTMKAVYVNDRPHTDFDPMQQTVRLSANAKQLHVRVEYSLSDGLSSVSKP